MHLSGILCEVSWRFDKVFGVFVLFRELLKWIDGTIEVVDNRPNLFTVWHSRVVWILLFLFPSQTIMLTELGLDCRHHIIQKLLDPILHPGELQALILRRINEYDFMPDKVQDDIDSHDEVVFLRLDFSLHCLLVELKHVEAFYLFYLVLAHCYNDVYNF